MLPDSIEVVAKWLTNATACHLNERPLAAGRYI